MTVAHSATLLIDEQVEQRRAAGDRVLHLGFGEVTLPVLPELAASLERVTDRNGYGPVAGTAVARDAAAGWFTRRGLETGGEQVVFAPGSKPLLFAVVAATDGDVVLPQPSWVSYAAQCTIAGRSPIWVPVSAEHGGVPDPEVLRRTLRAARDEGRRPALMVFTNPDNPTGTCAPPRVVEQVCAVAAEHDVAILSDEIYAELTHGEQPGSPTAFLPERTIVSTGLSKSLGLGGWRIGFARFPDNDWGAAVRARVKGLASELWSSLAAPMQEVAAYALGDPPAVRARIERSRRLHGRVARAVHAELVAAGADCRTPGGGFYLYPDLGRHRAVLAGRGIHTSTELAGRLLDEHRIATLPGVAFGDDPQVLALRLATSKLYGERAADRLAALDADAPERLPWIARDIAVLGDALRSLTG